MTDFVQDVAEVVNLEEVNSKSTSVTKSSSFTLADVLNKRGVKVLTDSITLTDAMGTSDAEGGYSTLRYADPESALAALVVKIKTIDSSKALNMIDVAGGYGGNQYVGQLLWEKD